MCELYLYKCFSAGITKYLLGNDLHNGYIMTMRDEDGHECVYKIHPSDDIEIAKVEPLENKAKNITVYTSLDNKGCYKLYGTVSTKKNHYRKEYSYGTGIKAYDTTTVAEDCKCNIKNPIHIISNAHRKIIKSAKEDFDYIWLMYRFANCIGPAIENDVDSLLCKLNIILYLSGHPHMKRRTILSALDSASKLYNNPNIDNVVHPFTTMWLLLGIDGIYDKDSESALYILSPFSLSILK